MPLSPGGNDFITAWKEAQPVIAIDPDTGSPKAENDVTESIMAIASAMDPILAVATIPGTQVASQFGLLAAVPADLQTDEGAALSWQALDAGFEAAFSGSQALYIPDSPPEKPGPTPPPGYARLPKAAMVELFSAAYIGVVPEAETSDGLETLADAVCTNIFYAYTTPLPS